MASPKLPLVIVETRSSATCSSSRNRLTSSKLTPITSSGTRGCATGAPGKPSSKSRAPWGAASWIWSMRNGNRVHRMLRHADRDPPAHRNWYGWQRVSDGELHRPARPGGLYPDHGTRREPNRVDADPRAVGADRLQEQGRRRNLAGGGTVAGGKRDLFQSRDPERTPVPGPGPTAPTRRRAGTARLQRGARRGWAHAPPAQSLSRAPARPVPGGWPRAPPSPACGAPAALNRLGCGACPARRAPRGIPRPAETARRASSPSLGGARPRPAQGFRGAGYAPREPVSSGAGPAPLEPNRRYTGAAPVNSS